MKNPPKLIATEQVWIDGEYRMVEILMNLPVVAADMGRKAKRSNSARATMIGGAIVVRLKAKS